MTAYKDKTAEMRLVELRLGEPIEALLNPTRGNGATIAGRLGISEGAVSKWRKRLGIRAPGRGRKTDGLELPEFGRLDG